MKNIIYLMIAIAICLTPAMALESWISPNPGRHIKLEKDTAKAVRDYVISRGWRCDRIYSTHELIFESGYRLDCDSPNGHFDMYEVFDKGGKWFVKVK